MVKYTHGGLAFSDDWGTLRNAANSALLALLYAKHFNGTQQALPYSCWALSQIRCSRNITSLLYACVDWYEVFLIAGLRFFWSNLIHEVITRFRR